MLGEVIVPEAEAEEGAEAEKKEEWKTVPPSQAAARKASRGATTTLLDGMASLSSLGGTGSQIGKSLHPLVCISVHPHCYLEDYGVWGREEYVRNWWGSVDWKKVEDSYAGFVKNAGN